MIQTTRHGFWGNGTAAATSGSAGKVTNGPTQSNSPSVRSTRVVHDFPPNVHNAWNSTFLCCTPSHISPPPKCDVEMHLPPRRGATIFAVGHGRRHVGRVFLYCGAPAAVCAACHTFRDINSLCTFPSQTTATTTTSWGQFYSHTKKSSSVWIARRLASMRNNKKTHPSLFFTGNFPDLSRPTDWPGRVTRKLLVTKIRLNYRPTSILAHRGGDSWNARNRAGIQTGKEEKWFIKLYIRHFNFKFRFPSPWPGAGQRRPAVATERSIAVAVHVWWLLPLNHRSNRGARWLSITRGSVLTQNFHNGCGQKSNLMKKVSLEERLVQTDFIINKSVSISLMHHYKYNILTQPPQNFRLEIDFLTLSLIVHQIRPPRAAYFEQRLRSRVLCHVVVLHWGVDYDRLFFFS